MASFAARITFHDEGWGEGPPLPFLDVELLRGDG